MHRRQHGRAPLYLQLPVGAEKDTRAMRPATAARLRRGWGVAVAVIALAFQTVLTAYLLGNAARPPLSPGLPRMASCPPRVDPPIPPVPPAVEPMQAPSPVTGSRYRRTPERCIAASAPRRIELHPAVRQASAHATRRDVQPALALPGVVEPTPRPVAIPGPDPETAFEERYGVGGSLPPRRLPSGPSDGPALAAWESTSTETVRTMERARRRHHRFLVDADWQDQYTDIDRETW